MNTELAKSVLAAIEMADLEENPTVAWDQGTWCRLAVSESGSLCGTAMCFAGWTVFLHDGDKEILRRWRKFRVYGEDGKTLETYICDRATELLELTDNESDVLFGGTNSLDDLRNFVVNGFEHDIEEY